MQSNDAVTSHTPTSDFPATLLARVLKANPAIEYDGMTPEGDLKFNVPIRALGLTRTTLARSHFTRSCFFVNLCGEVLIRKNLALFADLLQKLDPTEYHRLVDSYTHRRFGLHADEQDRLHFQCHLSLVQQILTEDLEAVV